MCAPEADERSIPEGEINDIFRANAKSPQAIAPHLANPVPVFHAIEHANRGTSCCSRGEMVANSIVWVGSEQIAEQRLLLQRFHPLFPCHNRNTAQIVQGLQLFR